MPLPNTRMIPEGWSRAHQPIVETAMRSRVQILRPQTDIPAPDPWGDQPAPVDPVLADDVPARIRALSDQQAVAASGQVFDTQAYLVQVPAGLMPALRTGKDQAAHRLQVTLNPEATGLVGQTMQILAAPHETEAFTRDLYVQIHTTQQG